MRVNCHYGFTDDLRDLRDDCVTEGFDPACDGASVQSGGNPIIHSTKRLKLFLPVIGPPSSCTSCVISPSPDVSEQPRAFQFPVTVGVASRVNFFRAPEPPSSARGAPLRPLELVGVGKGDPNAVTPVGRPKFASRKAIPFRIKPVLGHISENDAHSKSKQRCHVFHDREFGSYHANGTKNLPIESRTGAGNSGAFSGQADILAGEAADNDIRLASDELSIADIDADGDARPVLGEDAAAECVDLAECDSSHPGSFESEAETADAAEEVEDIQEIAPLQLFGAAASIAAHW
jgi:hypothetical protein